MTTNEPTEDPESGTKPQPVPAVKHGEVDVDMEQTEDSDRPRERLEESQFHAQQLQDRPEADSTRDELTHVSADRSLADREDKAEHDVGKPFIEEEENAVQEEEVGDRDDDANAETRAPIEQEDISPAPANSKEAIQDPGVLDVDPITADNGVIDVDTFDDDVSVDNDSTPSPEGDESMEEPEGANEPSHDETQHLVTHDLRSEAIDLTHSPPTQPKRDQMIPEHDEIMATEDRTEQDRHETLRGEDVIDIDEPEDKEEDTTAIEADDRQVDAGVEYPPVEEDGNHGKSNTDTETASAELNPDLNGEEVLSGEAPIDSTALETTAEGEMETHPSLKVPRVAEHSEENELSATERGNGSQDDEVEEEGREDTSKKADGVDITEPGAGKPETDSGEVQVPQDLHESEDDETDDDGASGRNHAEPDETEAEEDKSPFAPAARTGLESNVDEKMSSADKHEVNRGEGQDSLPKGTIRHPVPSVSGLEATEEKKTDDETTDTNHKHVLVMHPTSGDIVISATADGAHQGVEGKKRAEPDASVITVHDMQDKAEVGARSLGDGEANAACAGATSEPGSLEARDPNEVRSSVRGSDIRDGSVKGSGKEVVVESTELEKGVSAAPLSTIPAEPEANDQPSKQQDQESSEVQKGVDKKAEDGPSKVSSGFGSSEEVKRVPRLTENSSVEESKKPSTGHLAPMFGIQLSRPIKSGPVSFSSPTSFPRYSLNPQAAPFLPAKLRKPESMEQSADSSKSPARGSTPPSEVKVVEGNSQHVTVPKHDQPKTLDVDYSARESVETAPISSLKEDSAIADAKPEPSKSPLSVTPSESDKDMSKEGSDQSAPQIGLAAIPKPPVDKPATKKVSFAPTAIEIGGHMPKSEKEHATETGPAGTVQKVEAVDEVAVQGTQPDSKADNEKPSKLGKPVVEADDIKDKQRIFQVQTDEGLRREVRNVTVAMRQGNSKVRPERKKFTVRLTTGTEGTGKLQFFKTTGPSLKLYASLDSSKDSLRVRKVTNRQYVMSVAKVAPPEDDAANIIVKYFLHFEERDTFEEMYSQCVANLQRQPKPVVRTQETDENSKISKTVVKETSEDLNQLSSRNAGIKRAADTNNASQISKKSKLLADKKKLLDKMAALRRKKEQKGLSAKKEGQTQPGPEASSDVSAGSRATDKGSVRSGALKRKDATKPEVDPNNVVEATPTPKESTQLLRKRTAEDMSNENASKKSRGLSLRAAGHAIGGVRAAQLDGRSKVENMSQGSIRKAAEDDKMELGAEGGKSASADGADISKLPTDKSQLRSGEGSGAKGVVGSNTSSEPKSKETEALVKVTRDLKQSEEAKTALQRELDSRNRLLEAERERASRIQRENSDAWQLFVKTVEALSADMGRLRREHTDRSLESLTRCEPSSSEDFFDRLHSFRPSTWAAFENSEIGALECALRGWHNCGPGKIRSSEGSEITLSESFDDANFRNSEVERVRSLLREGHCLLSGWIGRACPDSFRTFEGSHRMITKEHLRANVEGLKEGLEGSEMKCEWGASALLLSDDICEKLAVYNWSIDGECLRCSWCNRRVVIDPENRFDAQSKHYAFCPFRAEDWETSVLRNAATLGIESDGDTAMKD